ALGRSRGGFSTKIHLKVDLAGLPLAFHLTGGEASDCRNFEILLDLGPDIAPRAAITDKGYADPPSSRKRSTRREHASNKPSENSSASNASRSDARRPRATMVPSWLWHSASS